MARRSQNNPRYRKDAQIGKTRKSSASAKPKRDAGERGTWTSAKKDAEPKKRRWFEPLPTPDTPEFKRWRRIWAILFVMGAMFSVFALYQKAAPIGAWSLVAAYTCLFSAIYIDITKIRRMRKAMLVEMQSGGKKTTKSSADEGTEKKGR